MVFSTRDKLRITLENLESTLLKLQGKQVKFISVIGSCRMGKSYFCNQLLKYWDSESIEKENAQYKNATTWLQISDPIKAKLEDGREVFILLMDTPGLFSPQSIDETDWMILSCSILLSQIVIWFSKRELGTDKISFFNQSMKQSRWIASRGSKVHPKPSVRRHAQANLMFIVREQGDDEDYCQPDVSPIEQQRRTVTEDQFLTDQIFESDMRHEEHNCVRREMLARFNNVSAFSFSSFFEKNRCNTSDISQKGQIVEISKKILDLETLADSDKAQLLMADELVSRIIQLRWALKHDKLMHLPTNDELDEILVAARVRKEARVFFLATATRAMSSSSTGMGECWTIVAKESLKIIHTSKELSQASKQRLVQEFQPELDRMLQNCMHIALIRKKRQAAFVKK